MGDSGPEDERKPKPDGARIPLMFSPAAFLCLSKVATAPNARAAAAQPASNVSVRPCGADEIGAEPTSGHAYKFRQSPGVL